MARVYGTQKYSIENLLQQQAKAQFDDYLKQAQKGSYKAPSKRGSGNQSWLSSIISELGGAGGAVGGAAAGAGIGSVVPVIGTAIGGLVGAGLGGFLGGTGGRLVENQVRDNELRVGDALKEGAFSGAASMLFPGGKALASGGKALTTGAGKVAAKEAMSNSLAKSFAGPASSRLATAISNKGGTALTGTADDIARGGIQSIGDSTRGFVRGIGAGNKLNANTALSTGRAKAANQAIDKATKGNLMAWTPRRQFTAVENRLASLYDDFAKSGEAGKTIGSTDTLAKKISENINKNVATRGTLSKTNQKVLSNILDDVKNLKGKSAKEVFEMAENLNKQASNIVEKGNIGSKEVKIYEAARQAIKDHIDELYPGKKALNKEVSALMDAKTLLSKSVEAGTKATQNQGFNLGIMAKGAATPVLDTAGRTLQTVGKATSPYAKLPVGANLVRQAPGNLYEAFTTPTPTQDPMQNMSPEDQALMAAYEKFSQENPEQAMNYNPLGEMQGGIPGVDQQAPMGDPQMTGQGGDMPQQSGMTKDQLQQMVMQDFAQTGGKNVTKLISLYEVLKAETPTSGGTLNSTAAGVVADTTTGLNALKQLSQDVSQSDANAPGIGWLRSKNPYDTNAQNLQAKIATTKQIVGKALEGGVLRKEDEVKYAKILPTLNDTDAVAQYKINALIDLISQRLNEYQSNIQGGTTSDLSNIMSQYQ